MMWFVKLLFRGDVLIGKVYESACQRCDNSFSLLIWWGKLYLIFMSVPLISSDVELLACYWVGFAVLGRCNERGLLLPSHPSLWCWESNTSRGRPGFESWLRHFTGYQCCATSMSLMLRVLQGRNGAATGAEGNSLMHTWSLWNWEVLLSLGSFVPGCAVTSPVPHRGSAELRAVFSRAGSPLQNCSCCGVTASSLFILHKPPCPQDPSWATGRILGEQIPVAGGCLFDSLKLQSWITWLGGPGWNPGGFVSVSDLPLSGQYSDLAMMFPGQPWQAGVFAGIPCLSSSSHPRSMPRLRAPKLDMLL